MKAPLSRYTTEIIAFQQATQGKAVYCFVVDGVKGTGGMPVIAMTPTHEEYLAKCREVVALLRRSADLLERDMTTPPTAVRPKP